MDTRKISDAKLSKERPDWYPLLICDHAGMKHCVNCGCAKPHWEGGRSCPFEGRCHVGGYIRPVYNSVKCIAIGYLAAQKALERIKARGWWNESYEKYISKGQHK